MAGRFLIYRRVLPLIPDAVWFTAREMHGVLTSHYPMLKLGHLRVALHMWDKKGLLISKPVHEEAKYLIYERAPRLYRKASSKYACLSAGAGPAPGQRKCLGCRVSFYPASSYNFMCAECQMLHHD